MSPKGLRPRLTTLVGPSCTHSLSQDESVRKMVEYVTHTPPSDADDMRKLKYPFMSCEVICCDIMSITETLATAADGTIVELLFEFLYQATPLDPRLAGYFEKVKKQTKHTHKKYACFIAL